MAKVLGIDLGPTSIGLAYLDDKKKEVLFLGSHIFPEGVNRTNQGLEISKNQQRREARQSRRGYFRKRLRKKHLLTLLTKHDMCPKLTSDEINAFLNKRKEAILPEAMKEWFALPPYALRAHALTERISLQELGRIFYHMGQRRGFLSNRKVGKQTQEEGALFEGLRKEKEGINIQGIDATRNKQEAGHFKTLGEYLASLQPPLCEPYPGDHPTIRRRYTERQMYVDEIRLIWEKQATYHKELTDELKVKIGGYRKGGDPQDGVLFYQRPLKSQKYLIGYCTFEKKKRRASKSCPLAEEVRIWQYVNNIRCDGAPLTAEERKKIALYLLLKKGTCKGSVLKKKIAQTVPGGFSLHLNIEDDAVNIPTAPISASLASKKCFGQERWLGSIGEKESQKALTMQEKMEIWHALFSFEDEEKLQKRLSDMNEKRGWGLNQYQIKKISQITLAEEYASISQKVMRNILPFLQQGYLYHEAILLGGIRNAHEGEWDKLPKPTQEGITKDILGYVKESEKVRERREVLYKANNHPTLWGKDKTNNENKEEDKYKEGYMPVIRAYLLDRGLTEKQLKKLYHHSQITRTEKTQKTLPTNAAANREIESIRNPLVMKTLFELRKVYNTLVKEFGVPDKIRIELARDMARSKKEREEIAKKQVKERIANEEAKNEVKNILKKEPTKDDIIKYKLWNELKGHRCPYTGDVIPLEQLYSNKWQIEHIIPRSHSLDNSFSNKTLCRSDINRDKGNKLPFEYFSEKGKWEERKQWAKEILPFHKNNRFTLEKVSQDPASRILNDTRYIAREAKKMMEKVCKEVSISNGRTTAYLRNIWGWNKLLPELYNRDIPDSSQKKEKRPKRADHRHHALDAAIIAVTSQELLERFGSYYKEKDDPFVSERGFEEPWGKSKLKELLFQQLSTLLVSHTTPRKIIVKRNYKVTKHGEKGKQCFTNLGVAARGPLHEESYYGKCIALKSDFANEKGPIKTIRFHKRKPIQTLKNYKQVGKVVDAKIRELIEKRVEALGGWTLDSKGKKADLPKNTFFETSYFLDTLGADGKKESVKQIELYDLPKKEKKKKKDQVQAPPLPLKAANHTSSQPTTKKIDISKITTKKHIDNIVDETLRNQAKECIAALGGFIGKEKDKVPPGALYKTQPQIFLPNKNKGGQPVPVKKVRVRETLSSARQLGKREKQYVDPGNNHHILIYTNVQGERKSVCVTFWDVVKRIQNKEKVYQLPENEREGEICFALEKGDFFLVKASSDETIPWQDREALSRSLYRVVKISKNIVLIHHTVALFKSESTQEKKKWVSNVDKYQKYDKEKDPFPLVIRKAPSSLDGEKVEVSLLGSIVNKKLPKMLQKATAMGMLAEEKPNNEDTTENSTE